MHAYQLILAVAAFGAALGLWRAARRGGASGLDYAQYAGVHGILFAILAMLATVILARMG